MAITKKEMGDHEVLTKIRDRLVLIRADLSDMLDNNVDSLYRANCDEHDHETIDFLLEDYIVEINRYLIKLEKEI